MRDMQAEVIRSDRRTVGLEVRADGSVLVRAPRRMTNREILRFLKAHEDWILRHIERMREREAERAPVEPLTEAQLRALADEARRVIPRRVAYYAPLVGVTYGRVTIRCQRTRWGSCGSTGNLNFNCLLMLAPPEVLDSVVVHELCHRLEMNHSDRFYAEVLRVYPEYRRWHGWLKQNGGELLRRLPA